MAFSTVTVTGNVKDLLGVAVNPLATDIRVTTNVPGDIIVDTADGEFRIADVRVPVAADGSFSFTVPKPAATTNPASWQTRVRFRASGFNGERITRTFGPFTINPTGSTVKLSALVDQQDIPPEYLSSVVAYIQGLIDDDLKGPQGDPGRSVVSILRTTGTGQPGATDTYTITYSSGPSTQFEITNGQNGAVPAARQIATSGGIITGGGDLSANRTITHDPAALAEFVRDTIGAALQQGSGISVVVNDAGDTITIAASGGAGGSGSILARKSYFPTPNASFSTTSTTPVDADATNLAITFTATTTAVRVTLQALATTNGGSGNYFWSLRSGSTDMPNTSVRLNESSSLAARCTAFIYVTGLTVGTAYTYKWAHRVQSGNTGVIRAGISSGESEHTTQFHWGAAIMEVVAA